MLVGWVSALAQKIIQAPFRGINQAFEEGSPVKRIAKLQI
jgi:hypothetical protein